MKKYLITFLILLATQGYPADIMLVDETYLMMHPDYHSLDITNKGSLQCSRLNSDGTLILLSEQPTSKEGVTGRGYVVAKVADLKALNMSVTDLGDPVTRAAYEAKVTRVTSGATGDYGHFTSGANRGSICWSNKVGEDRTVYATIYASAGGGLYNTSLKKMTFTTDSPPANGAWSTVTALNSGTGYYNNQIFGWTRTDATTRLVIGKQGETWGTGGWLVDVVADPVVATSVGTTYTRPCTSTFTNYPATMESHGHYTSNGTTIVNRCGSTSSNNVCVDDATTPCTYVDPNQTNVRFTDGTGEGATTHFSWNNGDADWWVGGGGWNNTALGRDEIVKYKIYQTVWDSTADTFHHNELTMVASGDTAAYYVYGGSDRNYDSEPSIWINEAGDTITYQSTGGRYSWYDHNTFARTPWANVGTYLSTLRIANDCEDGLDNDSDGLIDFAGSDTGCANAADDNEQNEIAPPNLTLLDSPRAVIKTQTLHLYYNLADEVGGTPTLDVKYDQTGSGCTGTLICDDLGIGTNVSCDIDTSGFAVGTYYFCGTTAGGDGVQDVGLYWQSVLIYESPSGSNRANVGLLKIN